ncbi:MAG: hypothetical protein JWP91_1633 [Fibrobacteres bacterium]|nr:hypothetical protein [Fibrobacterota bacterium]
MKPGIRFGALFIALALSGFADAPKNLTARFRSGQIFLTWDEDPEASGYKVYKIPGSLPSEADLTAGNMRVTVPKGFADNPILADLSKGAGPYGNSGWTDVTPACAITRNVVDGLDPADAGVAKPVPAGRNLVVLTSDGAGQYCYAVTSIIGGAEVRKIIAGTGGNRAGPVSESVQDPEPVLIWQAASKAARMYLQYVDIEKYNSVRYAWPYWVGAKPGVKNGLLELRLQGGDQHMQDARDSVTEFEALSRGVAVKVMPTEEWELWFGHSATYDYKANAGNPVADSGPIVNFSQARIMDFLHWMIEKGPYAERIDTNRIVARGASNGGLGCLEFSFDYPDFFAFSECEIAPTNIQDNDYGSGRYDEFFGKPKQNLKVSFTGWRSEGLKRAYEGTTVDKWLNLEQMLLEKPGADLPWIHVAHGGRDQVVHWPEQGKSYYTNLNAARRGFCGGVDGGGGHTGPDIPAIAQLLTLRKNHSYPAFSNARANAALPLPDKPEVKPYVLNTHLMWSTPDFKVGGIQNSVDEPNRYEIVIASSQGNDIADITPRRLQKFKVAPGKTYFLANVSVNDDKSVFQTDTIVADPQGLLTFRNFMIKSGDGVSGGSRLVIKPQVLVSILPKDGKKGAPAGYGVLYDPESVLRFVERNPRTRFYDVRGSLVLDGSLPGAGSGRSRFEDLGRGPFLFITDARPPKGF